jgi:hypothetical protein
VKLLKPPHPWPADATLDSVITELTGRLEPQDPWLVQAEKSRQACRTRAQ